jgi:hypothetical protein
MQNARDITLVTSKVGQEELNTIFPGNGTEYNIRFGHGATQPTPITEDSFQQEFRMMEALYTPVTASRATPASASTTIGAPLPAGTATAAATTVTFVTEDSKKLKAKMKLSKNRFSATFMCGDIDFKKGEIVGDISFPELTDAYVECIQSDGDMSTAQEMMKIMLDTANRGAQPNLTRNILSIYRRKRDHDPNLAASYCMGKFHTVALEDLMLDSTKANIWAMCEETDEKMKERKKNEDNEDAEEMVGEDTNNKSKKRIIINHVRTITNHEQLYKLLANHTHAQTACIKMKNKMTLYYRCEDQLISFLLEEDTMKWLEKNKDKQPQVYIWLVTVLDKLLSMCASAGSDHENLRAADLNDATKANKKTYEKAIARFCDYMDQWKKWVRNEVPMDVMPPVTPGHLRPGAKRQKVNESTVPQDKGNTQTQGAHGNAAANHWMPKGNKDMPYPLWQMMAGFANNGHAGQMIQQQGHNQDRGASDWRKARGCIVVLEPGFRYVMASGLTQPRCREWYATGKTCARGNNCNHQHGTFKTWPAEDKAKQIAHVRANKTKIAFNGNAVGIGDIGQENGDLISQPNRGGGNGRGNGGNYGRYNRGNNAGEARG